jgi:hypothetical protein
MNTLRLTATTAACAIVLSASLAAVPAAAHTTGIHDNCTNFNNKYPHGVGKKGATDKGGTVTNFRRSTKIYRIANRHNSTLDGDNDGIACEKA